MVQKSDVITIKGKNKDEDMQNLWCVCKSIEEFSKFKTEKTEFVVSVKPASVKWGGHIGRKT